MGYTVKILSNDEFEKLPYKHSSIALGVADPKTNTAYVRHSAHSDLNKYLIDHEFDHLVEEIPTDEIEGVRYKIPLLGPIASGIGSLASRALPAIGGAIGGLGGLAKSGIGAIGSGIGNVFNAGKSAISGIGSGIKSAGSGIMNMFGGSKSPGSIQNTSGQGFTTNFLTPNQLNFQRSMIPGGYSSLSSKGIMSGFKTNPITSNDNDESEEEQSPWKGLLNPQTILGAGSLAMGLFKKNPKVPQLPSSVESLRSQIQSGGSALGQQAQGVLSNQLSQQYNPLSEAEIQAALHQLEIDQAKAEDQVRDLYRNLRPGTDPSSDTSFRRDLQEVQDQFSRAKSDTLATRTRDTQAIFREQQSRAIQQALGASDSQMQQLAEIAQLDVQRIATQLGIDLASAQAFKETFINLGSDLLFQGLGGRPNTMSLFGGGE